MISINFNERIKLVRDQGVGGSNPLSPTNVFKHLQANDVLESRPSGISPGALVLEGASILVFSSHPGCKTIYKNIYSRKYESVSHAGRQPEHTTHLFDLKSDRHFGEEQLKKESTALFCQGTSEQVCILTRSRGSDPVSLFCRPFPAFCGASEHRGSTRSAHPPAP